MNNSDRKILAKVINDLDLIRQRLDWSNPYLAIVLQELVELLSVMIAKKADKVSSEEIDDMNSVWFGLGPDRVFAPA